MSVVLLRVDQRLLHGQVVEGWVPHLKVDGVVVADDRIAADPISTIAMTAACPVRVKLAVMSVADAAKAAVSGALPGARTLVLVGTIGSLARVWDGGLRAEQVNVGNVPIAEGRARVTNCVALSAEEVRELDRLAAAGAAVEVRTVPKDRASDLQAVHAAVDGGRS